MPQEPTRELSLYFHLDPELARNRDCFHFHVLLEGSRGMTPQGPAPAPTEPLVQFCVPPNGNDTQDVRTISGVGPGTICCIGRATLSGGHPSDVRGKIYASGSGLSAPVDPTHVPNTTRAQLVNCPSKPPFSSSLCGTTIEPNFVFNQSFRNEIPGAACGPYGVANDLVIWMRFSGVWKKSAPQLFRGICAPTTECGDSSGPSGEPAVASSAIGLLSGPKKLRVVSPGPAPKAGANLTLHRVGAERASIVTWQSCPQANPECSWKLWLKSNAGKPFATLALLGLDGKRLPVPLVWKCIDWQADAECQFTFSTPAGAKQAGSVARVVPV